MKKRVFVFILLLLLIVPIAYSFSINGKEIFSLNKVLTDFFSKLSGGITGRTVGIICFGDSGCVIGGSCIARSSCKDSTHKGYLTNTCAWTNIVECSGGCTCGTGSIGAGCADPICTIGTITCSPVCSGTTPNCVSGTCKCTSTSCGTGKTCNSVGACETSGSGTDVGIVGCTDTDITNEFLDGINLFVKGHTYGSHDDGIPFDYYDICYFGGSVREYWCDMITANNVVSTIKACPSNCLDGACVISCTDSDGGKIYGIKGTITSLLYGSISDGCKGLRNLVEYYCENGVRKSEIFTCPTFCIAGACINFGTGGACTEDWACTNWECCNDLEQIRVCEDKNHCGTTTNKPRTNRKCTTAISITQQCTSGNCCNNDCDGGDADCTCAQENGYLCTGQTTCAGASLSHSVSHSETGVCCSTSCGAGGGVGGCIDNDGDSYGTGDDLSQCAHEERDCDDNNQYIYPHNVKIHCGCPSSTTSEICDDTNNKDEDCDGAINCADSDCLLDTNCEKNCDELTYATDCRTYSDCWWYEVPDVNYGSSICSYCTPLPICASLGAEDDCKYGNCGLGCNWDDEKCKSKLCTSGDADLDSICDDKDNCVDIKNPDQANSDNDQIGDACDPDANGDNIDDGFCTDFDSDGICEEILELEEIKSCSDLYGTLCSTGQSCIGGYYTRSNESDSCCLIGSCGIIDILLSGYIQYSVDQGPCLNPNDEGIGKKIVVKIDEQGQEIDRTEEDCTILPEKATVPFYSLISALITILILIGFYIFRSKILFNFRK